MLKKILCVCFCFVMLCGCNENYGTQIYEGDSENNQNNSSDGEFEALKDIGKKYKLFDNSRVVSAYKSGDDSLLSDLEKEIFTEAKKVLNEIKETATSDYEIELAVHDYIVGSSTYDRYAVSALQKPKENSENPYGILINKTAICLGYTTTFQLFMDMAEIPCKTIYAENKAGDEHAWNQVKIGGRWYYVDCTWDDPVPEEAGRPSFHEYFNVTEEYMWNTGHRWDKDECSESDSYESSYLLMEACEVSTWDEIRDAMAQAVKDGKGDVVIACDRDIDGQDEVMTGGGKIFQLETTLILKSKKYMLYIAY